MPEESERSGPRSFWSGVLTFGLVSVPVEFWPAVRRARASLRMLDEDGTPLARRWYCPEDGQELTQDDIVRAYELDDGRFIVVEDEELEAAAPKKTREIDLRRFVDAASIPPLLFERAWFLTPGSGGGKAYRLLAQTMESTDRAGIATFVMREKEYLVAILSEHGFLRAETLRFADEVRDPDEIGIPAAAKVPAKSVEAMARAIAHHTKKSLSWKELENHETDRLLALVERKRKKGEAVVEPETVPEEEDEEGGVDLMEILKRSLASSGGGEKAGTGRRRAAKAHPKRKAGGRRAPPRRGALEGLSKEDLYARAQELEVPGRSNMSKAELARAIAERS